MHKHLFYSTCIAGSLFCQSVAFANGGPGLVFDDRPADVVRPSYRETTFPPPQYGLFGQRLPNPEVYRRPTYRQTLNDFPPPGGRFGGGIIEYVKTGGRPEPVRVQPRPIVVAAAAPLYAPAAAPAPTYLPGYAPPVPVPFFTPLIGSPPAAAIAAAPSGNPAAMNPRRGRLPRGGLPDYQPQQVNADASAVPAGYGDTAAGGAPAAGYDAAPLAGQQPNPAFERQVVAYSGRERPGTIVIDTPHKYLYLVEQDGQAIRYGIGVGRPGFTWAGVRRISRKAEWPGWTPPRQMLARRPDLPRHMDGGIRNPLGARAMYLGSSLYRIHGTNEPDTIGTNVSSGCIRMMNQDVIDLYNRVPVGTRVVVL